ncbi:putative Protein kinase domain-containing protein [Seiridium unicorne]|uniref:Protein kinase domain-containing protein n=1 Tax=Seiridium unicorne TaxID=138068 RepID=A0ABR2UN28_9PEZI
MGDIWDVAPGVLDQLHLSKMQTHTIQFWHVRNRATNFNSKDYGGIDQINIPRGTPPLGPGQKILPAVTMDSTPWPNRQGFSRARGGLDLDAVQNIFAIKEKKYRPTWARLGTVKDFFEGPNFTYRKCLGFGGHGLALHYRFGDRDQPDQQFDFVVKVGVSKWPNKGLRIEETETRKLARAAHIVQVIDAADIGRTPPKRTKKQPRQDDSSDEDDDDSGDEDVDPPPKRPRKRRDELTPQELARKKINWDKKPSQRSGYQAEERDDQDFLLLEFVENGDLTRLLVVWTAPPQNTSRDEAEQSSTLVVKMCIAMAFPPRKFHPDRKNHQGELDEVVPDAKHHWRMKRMVHFDLDPWNSESSQKKKHSLVADSKIVFIGSIEPDPSHHSLVPRLKLGDFGTAHEVKQQKREQTTPSKAAIFCTRKSTRLGLLGFVEMKLTQDQEQFTADWDYIPADRNGSNVMQSLITTETPRRPPLAGYLNMPSGEGGGETKVISYGAWLLEDEWARVDYDLRWLVAGCLCHDPADRPGLDELLFAAAQGCEKDEWADEDDAAIRNWLNDVLFNAPAAASPSTSTG